MALRGDSDQRVYVDHGYGGNLHIVTREYPIVNLQVVFASDPNPIWADVEYNFVEDFGKKREWGADIKIEFDVKNRYFLAYDNRRYTSIQDLSKALLVPLIARDDPPR
jgi:hypothetical protein